MSRELDFNERMRMSDGVAATDDVRTILVGEIPGAVSAVRASNVNDRQGVDWWVEMSTARHLAVDVKVREHDWAATHPDEDDLALETWSVVESQKIGWTRDESKRCDYILWLWQDTRRFCLLPFPMLCRVFNDQWRSWTKQFKTKRQKTSWNSGTYHSECVFVPRREVWAEIYRKFSGNLVAVEPAVVEVEPDLSEPVFWTSEDHERSPY
jgi:hypothetical protein